MEIKWVQTFIVAAKYENFRKTADDLFLTQPAITKHIQKLEQYLHTPLFQKNGKAVVLTPAGHQFLPFAKAFVRQYEQGLSEFELWKKGFHRKLTLAVAPQIASSVLPAILRKFMEQHRDIEVYINIRSSYEIGEDISEGKADLGLSRIPPNQPNVTSTIVHEDTVVLVGPLQCNEDDEATVLTNYRLLTHNHPAYWNDLLHDVKRYYANVRMMKVNQMEITKRFIEQGLGVSYLPTTVIRSEVQQQQLVIIPSVKIDSPTSLTYAVTKVQTDEAKAFIHFFQQEMVTI